MINELKDFNSKVTFHNLCANSEEAHEYNINAKLEAPEGLFDAISLTLDYQNFLDLDIDTFKNNQTIMYDVKGLITCTIDSKL